MGVPTTQRREPAQQLADLPLVGREAQQQRAEAEQRAPRQPGAEPQC